MKTSNILILGVLLTTVLVQVLLVFGYQKSYHLELANQKIIHPFGAEVGDRPFSVISANRVAMSLNIHPTQQGYKARYFDMEDMKKIRFRVQNDTLYIENLRKEENTHFLLLLKKIPPLICHNCHLNMRQLKTDSLQILGKSLTSIFMEQSHVEHLSIVLLNKSNINISDKTTIGSLTATLKDETRVSERESVISKVKFEEVSEKAAIQLSGTSYKAVQ